jgi:hypothetical protein
MLSVLRLFNLEAEATGRSNSIVDAPPVVKQDAATSTSVDPWHVVRTVASEGKKNLNHALRWLCLFARSGVDIPVSIFLDFSSWAVRFNINLDDGLLLVTASFSAICMRSVGRQQLHTLFSSMHCLLAPQVVHCLQTGTRMEDA